MIDRVVEVRPPRAVAARMFALNLGSWSSRAAAREHAEEPAVLGEELARLSESPGVGEITFRMRQLALRRPPAR